MAIIEKMQQVVSICLSILLSLIGLAYLLDRWAFNSQTINTQNTPAEEHVYERRCQRCGHVQPRQPTEGFRSKIDKDD